MTVTIKGLAYRAGSDPDDHPETWVVEPPPMSLRHQFDTQWPIGTVTVTRLPNIGIAVEASIPDEVAYKLSGCPYLAIALRLKPGGDDRRGAELYSVSVVDRNVDPDLPPYVITSIPDDVPARDSILRDYRPVTVVDKADLKSVDVVLGVAFNVTESHVEWHHHAEKPKRPPRIGVFPLAEGGAS